MNPDSLRSLADVLRLRARELPDRLAYTFLADGETEADAVTYGDLDRKSRAIAFLIQRRHAPAERALLLYPPGIDFIAAFFGCLSAGNVAVPAYPPRTARSDRGLRRLRAIARDADVTIVLATEEIVGLASEIVTEVPELGSAHWLPTERVPLGDAERWEEPAVERENLAFLQYTSGSTAEPKGVMVSHANLLHNLAYAHYLGENDGDSVSVSWLPVYHDMGLIEGVLQPTYGGYPAYLMPPAAFLQEPLRWLRAITRYRATNSGGPNFAFDQCVRKIASEELSGLDLSSWRVAYNGAEPIRWETLERFYETFRGCGLRWRSFYPVYGLAEATLVVSSGRQAYEPRSLALLADELAQDRVVAAKGGKAREVRVTACGPCSGTTRVVIAHPDTGERCEPGEIGEIWVQGPSVALGYWNRPEESRRSFQAFLAGEDGRDGPFLRTGDLGFLDRGELFVTGRLKDLVIVRGKKHYPQDIERTVEACHEAVRTGCVAAFGVEAEGEEGLAVAAEVEPPFLTLSGSEAVLSAIREAVAAHHEIPLHAVGLLRPGSLPKTTSGKVRRHACRAGFAGGSLEPFAKWVRASETT
jgi:acyl-CoA synthetase (AMP-forming)/AMP-acid ligase II